MTRAALLLLVGLLLCATAAQADPGLVAATWCPVYTAAAKVDGPACDAGLGLSLWHSRRLPPLGVAAGIGMQTVGVGVSWTVNPHGEKPLSVILGAIAPHDERGIYAGRWALALGATFSVGGST